MTGRRDRRTADSNTNIKEPVKQALRKRYFHNPAIDDKWPLPVLHDQPGYRSLHNHGAGN